MRALVTLPAVLALCGCGFLYDSGILPVPGSKHLQDEPLVCGELDDPVHTSDASKPIVGAADYHLHQFANLGFGGRIFWGDAWSPAGMESALAACGVNDLCTDKKEDFLCEQVVCRFASDHKACKEGCEDFKCGDPPPHGRGGLLDPLSGALRGDFSGHAVTGYPNFAGWPKHDNFTHQQIYHRWLRRAFDGGLKLIVNLAVSNEVLCEIWEHDHACDDMTNVDIQLEAARELEQYIDYQNDCQLNGNGWYRIAESPAQARQIIADGAMAVVLGIEVDSLFNCYDPDKPRSKVSSRPTRHTCSPDEVRRQLEKYQALGVRHIFPIHLFDNAFGATAAAEDYFSFGNLYVNGELIDVKPCEGDNYSFRYGAAPRIGDDIVAFAAKTLGFPYERYESMPTHCAQHGLTDLGRTFINQLIDHKMIIDVDHMSTLSRTELLTIAEGRGMYPGLVSGHSGFTDVSRKNKRHEGQLNPEELRRFLALGGVLAPELNQGSADEVHTIERPKDATQIKADCGGSSKEFAQAYFFATDRLKAQHDSRVIGVGYGSDFNGLVESPAPRFGPRACDGARHPDQGAKVEYPIETYEKPTVEMDKAMIGSRAFDINDDGFANVGMFPDFVADLRQIGMTTEDLRPLFNGAEAYIEMWERVQAGSFPKPPRE